MIRIDAIWLATEPMDMRAGTETGRLGAPIGCSLDLCAAVNARQRS